VRTASETPAVIDGKFENFRHAEIGRVVPAIFFPSGVYFDATDNMIIPGIFKTPAGSQ
jgi:hypothetical protein